MKLLHVINSLHFGGAEKLILDTVPEFKKQGMAVSVMVLYYEETPIYKELENTYNIKIIAPLKQKSLYSLTHLFWVRKQIKGYDIVHVHLFPSTYWVAIASLFLRHKPQLILTEHSTNNRRRSSLIWSKIDAVIYKQYSTVIAISESVKNNLKKHLGSHNVPIKLIHNGIRTASIHKAQPYSNKDLSLPEDIQIVIQVANFTPSKDQGTVIKAMGHLPKNVHLLLVGSGLLIEDNKGLVKSLDLEGRVHFLGYRSDVARLLKTSHICVLSSFYEGFGLSIIEGMAAGLPSLGSNIEGLSEVIGEAGIVFEKENSVTLSIEIKKLLLDRTYYNRKSQMGLKRAAVFDISKMVDSYVQLYDKLKNTKKNDLFI